MGKESAGFAGKLFAKPNGENMPTSDRRRKLTEKQVSDIRASREKGESVAEIAGKYGLAKSTVWLIVNELTWKPRPQAVR